jgi:hypothetical protein
MLNLSPLFYSSVDNDNLLQGIELDPVRKAYFEEAKNTVRTALRTGLPVVLKQALPDITKTIEPRFFTQGSWAYKTLNAPARAPQQADVDDGAYMPLSFMASRRPSIASKIFFASVETVLAPLAQKKGWKLITTKPTCTRIEVARDGHIDIPLYAIPDDEYARLEKAAALRFAEAALDSERDNWDALPPDSVLLAHREEDWISSDPRPIKQWFTQQVMAHGEQLRRVVRYLKAYRDWQWETGGPSSILLMAAAVDVFESRDRRDDLALLDVVKQLPARLRDGVDNPTDGNESFTKRLGTANVEIAAQSISELEKYLDAALHSTSPDTSCAWLIDKFGPRFPCRPDLVKTVSVAATISTIPPKPVASPLVGRTKAG